MKPEGIVHVAEIPLVLKRCTMSILVQTLFIYVTCVIQGAKITDLALSEPGRSSGLIDFVRPLLGNSRMRLPSSYADCICRAHDCDSTMLLMCRCNALNLG